MNLRDRLASFRPAATQTPATGADSTPQSLTERVERMAARARGRMPTETDIAVALGGTLAAPGLIRIEQCIPLASRIGRIALDAILHAPLAVLAPEQDVQPEQLVFLDTETTGLAGGTGTLAFLLAMARAEGDSLVLTQWLLTAFKGETAMLDEARRWLPPEAMLVSFNGRSFDVPLLATRARLNRVADAFTPLPHIDLLPPTRRAFAKRWENCRLQTAERRLLHFHRDDDLPGAAMPQAWTNFLRTGLAAPMRAVLEHNRRDVVSLAALMATLAEIFVNADASECDAVAIARGHIARGEWPAALELLVVQEALLEEEGLLLLAALLRRANRRDDAVPIWQRLAQSDVPEAIEALAKHHEHARQDYDQALRFTGRLSDLLDDRTAVDQRVSRLTRKLARKTNNLW